MQYNVSAISWRQVNDMSSTVIYQFRCSVKHISPMIWRRILVKSDSSIADLHHTLQMSFGWGNTYLHCFTIRANEYGIAYSGGICFDGDADSTLLESFDFDVGETFVYEYNFNDDWELQIRLEKILEIDLKRIYPHCIGGNRAGPLEDCGGVESYMEHAENYGREMALPTLANFRVSAFLCC